MSEAGEPATDLRRTGPEEPSAPAPFDRVMKMRVALAAGLVIPLAFFVFLVIRFDEAWLLAGAGALVYLYILAQFFVWQNPRWRARQALPDRKEAGASPEDRG